MIWFGNGGKIMAKTPLELANNFNKNSDFEQNFTSM